MCIYIYMYPVYIQALWKLHDDWQSFDKASELTLRPFGAHRLHVTPQFFIPLENSSTFCGHLKGLKTRTLQPSLSVAEIGHSTQLNWWMPQPLWTHPGLGLLPLPQPLVTVSISVPELSLSKKKKKVNSTQYTPYSETLIFNNTESSTAKNAYFAETKSWRLPALNKTETKSSVRSPERHSDSR